MTKTVMEIMESFSLVLVKIDNKQFRRLNSWLNFEQALDSNPAQFTGAESALIQKITTGAAKFELPDGKSHLFDLPKLDVIIPEKVRVGCLSQYVLSAVGANYNSLNRNTIR
jgi:hypothetical protein